MSTATRVDALANAGVAHDPGDDGARGGVEALDAVDRRIAHAIARGHYRRALELTARDYGAALGRFCMAIVDDRAEAEELAQEILLAAHDAMPRFEGRSLVRTWLYAIARRTCRRRLRQREHRRALLGRWRGAARSWTSDDSAPLAVNPLEHVGELAARRRLQEALAQLPARQHEALLLRFVGGLSHREVAACCGVREATARQRCCAALRRLRALLSEPQASPAVPPLGCAVDEEVTR